MYELVDPRDNKVFYVGKGTGKRMYVHEKKVLSGKHENYKLLRFISELLKNNLKIIYNIVFESEDENKCLDKEIELVNKYKIENLCNLTFGGGGLHVYFTDEVRRKMSESQFGKKLSKETREKMSKSRMGDKNPFYGKKLKKSHIKKLGKLAKLRSGKNHFNAKSIYQIDKTTGEIIQKWDCIADVERELKIPNSDIIAVCRGKRCTAGEFIWVYCGGYSKNNIKNRILRIKNRFKSFCKPVSQMSKNGKIIKEWKSVACAGRGVGVTSSAILRACKEKTNSCKGYFWKYKGSL